MVGFVFTNNDTVDVFEHEPVKPVTVYIVVAAGLTLTVDPVRAPGFHVYDVAPPPVKVADEPAQIAVGLDTAVTVGFGFTIKLTVVLAVQPTVVVPATVYTVVAVGVTTTDVPEMAPGLHV
jgi:hypothetical protein